MFLAIRLLFEALSIVILFQMSYFHYFSQYPSYQRFTARREQIKECDPIRWDVITMSYGKIDIVLGKDIFIII